MRMAVEPVSADAAVPPHPIDGTMPAEGANWTADQYTFRLIEDGVIRRKPDEDVAGPEVQSVEGGPVPGSEAQPEKPSLLSSVMSVLTRPAEPVAEPAAAQSISFMITQDQKAELRQRGFSDDQIAHMTPEDAHRELGFADQEH